MDRVKLANRLLKINYLLAIVIFVLLGFYYNAHADVNRAELDSDVSFIGTKVPGEIRIMEIDTGIGSHPRLDGYVQYDGSENYTDNAGHGTHVAGIIVYGNKLRDNRKFEPVCSNVKIFSCKFFDPNKKDNNNLREAINCINRAIVEKMDVINISEGGLEYSEQEYQASKQFVSTGGMIIACAGNERNRLEDQPYYPASYGIPHIRIQNMGNAFLHIPVIPLNRLSVVMNIEQDGSRAPSSNFANYPIKKEMGTGIYSTLPNGQYGLMTGTSQATPAYLHRLLIKKCNEMKKE